VARRANEPVDAVAGTAKKCQSIGAFSGKRVQSKLLILNGLTNKPGLVKRNAEWPIKCLLLWAEHKKQC
jgi:hypothetical protein